MVDKLDRERLRSTLERRLDKLTAAAERKATERPYFASNIGIGVAIKQDHKLLCICDNWATAERFVHRLNNYEKLYEIAERMARIGGLKLKKDAMADLRMVAEFQEDSESSETALLLQWYDDTQAAAEAFRQFKKDREGE